MTVCDIMFPFTGYCANVNSYHHAVGFKLYLMISKWHLFLPVSKQQRSKFCQDIIFMQCYNNTLNWLWFSHVSHFHLSGFLNAEIEPVLLKRSYMNCWMLRLILLWFFCSFADTLNRLLPHNHQFSPPVGLFVELM
jgi:hypothetical protein